MSDRLVFIHETAENRAFERLGPSQGDREKALRDYKIAHNYAQNREAVIRGELGITGGFAGGYLDRQVPER